MIADVEAPRCKVFVSHTTRDARDHTLAHAIADGLRQRGAAEVWIAPDSIPSGEEWEPAIVEAILEECSHFLVILSAAGVAAPWVLREIGLARERRNDHGDLVILPLPVGPLPEYEFGDYLGRFQALPYHADVASQVDAVAGALYLPPPIPTRYRSLIEDKTTDFVGRSHVFDALREFCEANDRGYFAVEGEPGIGKSALLAELARRTGCIVHFNERSQNVTTPEQFIESACAQLAARYGLDYHEFHGRRMRDGRLLSELLDRASDPDRPVLLAIDALDEAEAPAPSGANVLYLPPTLPAGVYIVISYRHRASLPLVVHAPLQRFDLSEAHEAAEGDARAYVELSIATEGVLKWIADRALTEAEFTELLVRKSAGNFMYLRYVLADIAHGRFAELDSEHLPERLQGYYEEHWRRMGMTASPPPRTRIHVLYVICELRRPATRSVITRLAAVEADPDEIEVQWILDDWREFMRIERGPQGSLYSIYHTSFREFLHRKDVLSAAGITLGSIRGQIADALWQDLFDDER